MATITNKLQDSLQNIDSNNLQNKKVFVPVVYIKILLIALSFLVLTFLIYLPQFTFGLSFALALLIGILAFYISRHSVKAKLITASMVFVITLGSGFVVGAFANTFKVNQIATSKSVAQSSSKSSKSSVSSLSNNKNTIDWKNAAKIVDANYNANPAQNPQNYDQVLAKSELFLTDSAENTKSKKNVKILSVLSSTSVLISELGEVQLIGLEKPSKTGACFELEATKRLEEIVKGQNIYLEFDPVARFDRSNRVLAYLYLESQYFVNLEMIRDGYTLKYENMSKYFRDVQFETALEDAKNSNSGIWSNYSCDQKSDSSSSSVSTNSQNSSLFASVQSQPKSPVIALPTVPTSSSGISQSAANSAVSSNNIQSSVSNSSIDSTANSKSVSSQFSSSSNTANSEIESSSAPIKLISSNKGKKCVLPGNTSEYENARNYESFSTLEECLRAI
jgi:endonuclease YncB( thermonuclease family)